LNFIIFFYGGIELSSDYGSLSAAGKHSGLWQQGIMSEFGFSDSVFSVIACQFATFFINLDAST